MPIRLALVLSLSLAACRIEAPPDLEAASAAVADTAGALAVAPPPVEQAIMPRLALDTDGLRLVNPETGASQPLAFGTPADRVLDALEPLREPARLSRDEACASRPMTVATWPDGLDLAFRDSAFVGWRVEGRTPRAEALTTLADLGIGSTRALLDSAYAVEVTQTTAGTEFTTGALSGLLDGPGPEARVSALWSGATCSAQREES